MRPRQTGKSLLKLVHVEIFLRLTLRQQSIRFEMLFGEGDGFQFLAFPHDLDKVLQLDLKLDHFLEEIVSE